MRSVRSGLAEAVVIAAISAISTAPSALAAPELIYEVKVPSPPPPAPSPGSANYNFQNPGPPSAVGVIQIKVGRSEVLRPSREFKTVIVGNEKIADASTEQDLVIITGVETGLTNLIILDDTGAEIMSATVEVIPATQPPRIIEVNVLRGVSVTQYACGEGNQFCLVVKDDARGASPAAAAESRPIQEPLQSAPAGQGAS